MYIYMYIYIYILYIQGAETDIVLLSVVRGHGCMGVGFLKAHMLKSPFFSGL